MSLPESYQAFRRTAWTADQPTITIEEVVEKGPAILKPDEVLIRIRAVSLNFRDVAMLNGRYPVQVEDKGIPASNCAAKVVAIGASVHDFKIGDRVAAIFEISDRKTNLRALGGDVPGVLREFAIFDHKYLVHLPEHLSWEEASTIPCAGVTAWTALDMPRTANDGNTALLQGTGGVSMFALYICLTAGIHSIITSPSDEKLSAIRQLAPEGSISTINFKTNPNILAKVKQITGGKGVDIVVNHIGPTSVSQDIQCLRRSGVVSLVGFLGGADVKDVPDILTLIVKTAKIQGNTVGSKRDFEDLNRHLQRHKMVLKTLIGRTIEFDDSKTAFNYLYSGKNIGKVVIKSDGGRSDA